MQIAFKFTLPLLLLASCAQSQSQLRSAAVTTPPIVVSSAPVPEPITPVQMNHRTYVEHLQRALAGKGYYHGKIDGSCGEKTHLAVRHYQFDLDVAHEDDSTCRVGHETWSGLGLSPGMPEKLVDKRVAPVARDLDFP